MDFFRRRGILTDTIMSEKEGCCVFRWFQRLVSIRLQELNQIHIKLHNDANR